MSPLIEELRGQNTNQKNAPDESFYCGYAELGEGGERIRIGEEWYKNEMK